MASILPPHLPQTPSNAPSQGEFRGGGGGRGRGRGRGRGGRGRGGAFSTLNSRPTSSAGTGSHNRNNSTVVPPAATSTTPAPAVQATVTTPKTPAQTPSTQLPATPSSMPKPLPKSRPPRKPRSHGPSLSTTSLPSTPRAFPSNLKVNTQKASLLPNPNLLTVPSPSRSATSTQSNEERTTARSFTPNAHIDWADEEEGLPDLPDLEDWGVKASPSGSAVNDNQDAAKGNSKDTEETPLLPATPQDQTAAGPSRVTILERPKVADKAKEKEKEQGKEKKEQGKEKDKPKPKSKGPKTQEEKEKKELEEAAKRKAKLERQKEKKKAKKALARANGVTSATPTTNSTTSEPAPVIDEPSTEDVTPTASRIDPPKPIHGLPNKPPPPTAPPAESLSKKDNPTIRESPPTPRIPSSPAPQLQHPLPQTPSRGSHFHRRGGGGHFPHPIPQPFSSFQPSPSWPPHQPPRGGGMYQPNPFSPSRFTPGETRSTGSRTPPRPLSGHGHSRSHSNSRPILSVGALSQLTKTLAITEAARKSTPVVSSET
jgi:hypothetical protein